MQYDPQNICGRNIDIALHARVKDIRPNDYHRWLYGEKCGIEIYDKELCVILIEDLSICRGRYTPSRKKKVADFIINHKSELKNVLSIISRKGEICSRDLEKKISKKALDILWKMGKIFISSRKNGIKYFDLPERLYENKIHLNEENVFSDEQVLRRINSVGLLPKSGTGSGWLGIGRKKEIVSCLDKMIDAGHIKEINIEGIDHPYIINNYDYNLLSNISKILFTKRISFIPPLDNLLWDRKLVSELFDFDYKWEAYTPKTQRVYGHYVLPILYGTDFIGRIEPIYNRSKNTLVIKGCWLETKCSWDNKTHLALLDCLEELKVFLGATSISWLCKKPKSD